MILDVEQAVLEGEAAGWVDLVVLGGGVGFKAKDPVVEEEEEEG